MLIKLMPQVVATIREIHPDEWVVLSAPTYDERGNLVAGIVLYASKDQNELYARTKDTKFRDFVYWHTSKDTPAVGCR